MTQHAEDRGTAPAHEDTVGMKAMFWAWMGIIIVGLVVMIAIPLGGN